MVELSAVKTEEKKSSSKQAQNIIEDIKARRSQELIIGLCGAIGTGTKELDKELQSCLEGHGYKIEQIKISDLIIDLRNKPDLRTLSGAERYREYQTAGNDIREKLGDTRLAEEAITQIVDRREKHLNDQQKSNDHKNTKKTAYIINQLKHPSEVKLFQTVYKQNFYLIGLSSTEKERKNYLFQQSIKAADIDDLFHKDRKDSDPHGQQVEKTFFLADYFIRNRHNNASHLNKAIERFIKLIHGYNGITPSNDEKGMYEAFSASLQSACLSRQVGAAIMNKSGDILSTGCNDVPVFGGGLYNESHGNKDLRCIFKGKYCYNDKHKSILEEQFKDVLVRHEISNVSVIARELIDDTKAKALIEYSRAIHAEMAALLQVARVEGQTTVGTNLYCTTYPCHSCARHIVAAGVHKVIYIEPYEKSLALQLHDDAITDTDEQEKVKFEPFEGVSPKRYSKFFYGENRKDFSGNAVIMRPEQSHHIDPQYLDSYTEYEDKVTERAAAALNPFKQ